MKFHMNVFLTIAALTVAIVSASDAESTATPKDAKDNGATEETRKLQYYAEPSYGADTYGGYGNPYAQSSKKKKAKKGKGKKGKKKGNKGKYSDSYSPYGPSEPSYGSGGYDDYSDDYSGGGGGGCAELYCDGLFKKAGYYFTREKCQWTPGRTTMGDDFSGCKVLDPYEQEACSCYWKYEVQCDSNVFNPIHPIVADGETDFDLAMEVAGCIGDGKCCPYYGSYYGGGYRKLDGYDQTYEAYTTSSYYKPCEFDNCFSPEIYNCFCDAQNW